MDKNRIRGIRRRTSRPMTTKSRSIKGADCRSGDCTPMAPELTSGGRVSVRLTGPRGEQSDQTGYQERADGIVVLAGKKVRTNDGRARRRFSSATVGRTSSWCWPSRRKGGAEPKGSLPPSPVTRGPEDCRTQPLWLPCSLLRRLRRQRVSVRAADCLMYNAGAPGTCRCPVHGLLRDSTSGPRQSRQGETHEPQSSQAHG